MKLGNTPPLTLKCALAKVAPIRIADPKLRAVDRRGAAGELDAEQVRVGEVGSGQVRAGGRRAAAGEAGARAIGLAGKRRRTAAEGAVEARELERNALQLGTGEADVVRCAPSNTAAVSIGGVARCWRAGTRRRRHELVTFALVNCAPYSWALLKSTFWTLALFGNFVGRQFGAGSRSCRRGPSRCRAWRPGSWCI